MAELGRHVFPRFRRGQLVAVRQFEKDPWVVAVYCSRAGSCFEQRHKARRLGYSTEAVRWRYCLPAQDVWPWMNDLRPKIVCEETYAKD